MTRSFDTNRIASPMRHVIAGVLVAAAGIPPVRSPLNGAGNAACPVTDADMADRAVENDGRAQATGRGGANDHQLRSRQ